MLSLQKSKDVAILPVQCNQCNGCDGYAFHVEAVSTEHVTILSVQCNGCDGYAVYVEAVSTEHVTILSVQCNGCDGYAVHVEAVRAEDETDLLEVEWVHLVVVLPVHVHNRHLCF